MVDVLNNWIWYSILSFTKSLGGQECSLIFGVKTAALPTFLNENIIGKIRSNVTDITCYPVKQRIQFFRLFWRHAIYGHSAGQYMSDVVCHRMAAEFDSLNKP